jgi:hypothetical protein
MTMASHPWQWFHALAVPTCFCDIQHGVKSAGLESNSQQRLQMVKTGLALLIILFLAQWTIGHWSGSLALQMDAMTYGTTILGATGNSALSTTNPTRDTNPVRTGFGFNPKLNPGSNARNAAGTAAACQNGAGAAAAANGNIVGYEPAKGRPNP